MQALGAGRDHQVLEEHAVVQPAALAQDPVDGEDEAHGRTEEAVVPGVLGFHPVLVPLGDAQEGVEIEAHLPAAFQVGGHPLAGVVVIFLAVGGQDLRVVVGRQDAVHQALTGGSGEDVHPPGLGVGARGGAGGQGQDGLQHIPGHRGRQEGPDGAAALQGIGHGGGSDGGGGLEGVHARLLLSPD